MSLRPNSRPSQDREFSMPPPSLAWQPSPLTSVSVNGAERLAPTQQQLTDKYSNLKRRYFQLDDRLKESQVELRKSMERNTKLRSERNILLDRIIELEERNKLFERRLDQLDPAFVAAHKESPAVSTGAFPRALVTQRAQAAFVANLQQAMVEVETEDPSVDPLLFSRHVGPIARKREAEEQERRQQEEETRDLKRQRRPRGSGSGSGNHMPATDAASLHPVQFQWRASSGTGTPVLTIDRSRPQPQPAREEIVSSPPVLPVNVVPSSAATSSTNGFPAPQRNVVDHSHSHSHSDDGTPRPHSESPISPDPAPYYAQQQPRFAESDSDARAPTSRSQSRSLPPPPPRDSIIVNGTPGARPVMPPPPPGPPRILLPPPANTSSALTVSVTAPRPTELQRLTKPKRLKAHTVTSKSHSIPTVPRDRATGRPLLPLNVGIMTVLSLGEICIREHFHTERYIFPIGYEVTRRYLSTQDPNAEVVYHCTILDGGDGPKFQIIAADMPDKPIVAGTATGAWSGIVRAANLIRKRQHSNSVSGPDYFGLGQNTIKHLIQELPGADRLKNYVWQNFVEGGPLGGRHAAVIPALPEEYESSMAAGAYYNRERDRSLPMHHGDPAAGLGLSVMPEPIVPYPEDEYDRERDLDGDHLRDRERPEYEFRRPSRRGRSASSSSNSTISARRPPSTRRRPDSGATTSPPPPSSSTSSRPSSVSVYSPPAHSPSETRSTIALDVDSRQTTTTTTTHSRSQSQSQLSSPSVPPKLASIMNAYAPPSAPLTTHSRAASAAVAAATPRTSFNPESAVVHA